MRGVGAQVNEISFSKDGRFLFQTCGSGGIEVGACIDTCWLEVPSPQYKQLELEVPAPSYKKYKQYKLKVPAPQYKQLELEVPSPSYRKYKQYKLKVSAPS